MFNKILIANRGEIACRIIRSAQQMGIQCVAIYSTADEHALHVKLADEAYFIGESPSSESYLQGERIINVAKQSRCEAIHPGYGFLSESPEFANVCEKNNITFIGPSSASILAMGDKAKAKQLLEGKNTPLTPGYHGSNQEPTFLQQQAENIGYPVLLKAAAGGGGKGMRVVDDPKNFSSALASAKREALASFADDTFIIEKLVQNPRHIEIQIFADDHGNYVYLFERDCSIQRRHQKILEEAPAIGISAELRSEMGKAAIAVAQSVDYLGAGTVEFLLDEEQNFYFMEMNTRLQVEHPITEMITGIDLVQWQLLIANGETLPLTQEQLTLSGHAIEVRIYAEDPYGGFLPSIGKLVHLAYPVENKHVRIDSGITESDEISPYYDPMIAKLIVWDKDRSKAIVRLQKALWETQIVGLKTNIPFLKKIYQISDYQTGNITTNFVEQHHDELLAKQEVDRGILLCLGALYLLLNQGKDNKLHPGDDKYSPWGKTNQWRLNLEPSQEIELFMDGQAQLIYCLAKENNYQLECNGANYAVSGRLTTTTQLDATINHQKYQTTVIRDNNEITVFGHNLHYCLSIQTLESINRGSDDLIGNLTSPMPGTVVSVLVDAKKEVDKGTPLLIIEAMKMEHTLYAPSKGTVKKIHYKQGDLVKEGVQLIEFEANE